MHGLPASVKNTAAFEQVVPCVVSQRELGNALWCPEPESNRHDLWSRDFKSLASTCFAIRACRKRACIVAAMRRSVKSGNDKPRNRGACFFGGRDRNRTDVRGFAGRCMTTLPPGRMAVLDLVRIMHRIELLNNKTPDGRGFVWKLEREKGLEPSTPTLARSCSTN